MFYSLLLLFLFSSFFTTGDKIMSKATFAAGCFWGVEAAFQKIEGVIDTRVGYTGGSVENPTYEEVCTGLTGHAEAVEITYDSTRITYEELLNIFWKIHDPTTPDRQGPDIGSQYRSMIFYHDDRQKQQAQESKDKLDKSGRYRQPLVTGIAAAATFYPAEEYHQKYLEKRSRSSYGY